MASSGASGGRAHKGNSHRKGPSKGSGGAKSRGLTGRGPTPPAEERHWYRGPKSGGPGGGGKPGGSGGKSGGGGRAGGPPRGERRGAKGASDTIAGRNSVLEALQEGVPASALYVQAGIDGDDRVLEAIRLANLRELPLLEGSRFDLDKLSDHAVHQGLVLGIPPYSYVHHLEPVDRAHDVGATPLLVALDGVTDPRNLGAIIRSTAAFGGHGVVVPERRSAGMTASAWKASAGAAARIPVAQVTNLTRALKDLQAAGCQVVGLDAEGDVSVDDLDLGDHPTVLVIGSEGKGLSRLVRESCDRVASIPMAVGTESLNASVAAGIALFAVAQQRRHATAD